MIFYAYIIPKSYQQYVSIFQYISFILKTFHNLLVYVLAKKNFLCVYKVYLHVCMSMKAHLSQKSWNWGYKLL